MSNNHFEFLTQGITLKNGCLYRFTNTYNTTITRLDKDKKSKIKDECWFLDHDEIYNNFVKLNK